jgi:hypothetical protein
MSDAPLTGPDRLARAAQARLARTINIGPDFGTRLERGWTEQHGLPWAVWSFAPIFAIYDLSARAFNPQLLAALMD